VKIGATLPIGQRADGSPNRYAEIRDLAQGVEESGLDSVWLFDHLLFRRGDPVETEGIWESWTMLSALAEATARVEIGTIVLCTAFRNPALLAKMADALQEVSDGRLILGLGAGWHQPEFDAFGYPFDHLASRFEEAIQIIAPLVRTGAVDFTGSYERAVDAVSLPRGPKPPPILIGASKPRMLDITARVADAWNTAWIGWPEGVLPARVADLDAACARVGRDRSEIELSVGVVVAFPDLGYENPNAADRAATISGDAAEIAAAFRAHEQAGVGHLILNPQPSTPEAYARLAEAVAVYRAG
jgi:alkanesulfonate monooxygenase SsuD/methylene tetrahydromethanopterin reductase-like flavin-dependent oxidoreductase (luciferase family)